MTGWKKQSVFKVFTIVLGTLCLSAASAFANPKIGTIDMQKALESVSAGKTAKENLQKEFQKKNDEFKKEEAELKKAQDELIKQSKALSESALQKKQRDLQEKILKFQEKVTNSQMEIQKKEQELVAPIIGKIKNIVNDIAKKDGYTLVLEKNENRVLFSLDQDDLTSKVVSAYK